MTRAASNGSIMILSCAAGGAHRACADALVAQLSRTGTITEIVDAYAEALDPIDPFRALFGQSITQIYNEQVQRRGRGGIFWMALATLCSLIVAVLARRGAQLLAERLARSNPALIVCIIPLLGRLAIEGAMRGAPNSRVVTLALDLKECVAGVWIQDRRQTIMCATTAFANQARAAGIPSASIHIVRLPTIEPNAPQNVAKHFPIAGTVPHPRLHALLMFGAQGCDRMLEYAEVLARHFDVSCICGHNAELRAQLETRQLSGVSVEGFVPDMSDHYAACDFVVSKPGPMTLWEAVAFRKPLILELNMHTLIQERHHARWAVRKGIGITFSHGRELHRKARRITESRTLGDMRVALIQLQARNAQDCVEALMSLLENTLP